MTTPFPHHYDTTLYWSADSRGSLSAYPRPDIQVGAPPQFGGDPERWSPEHLLLGSVSLCLMTTFMAVAAKSQLGVLSYKCRAEGVLDRAPAGPRFTSIVLSVTLGVQGEKERGLRLLEIAEKNCLVANSLNCPVTLAAAVNGWSPSLADA